MKHRFLCLLVAVTLLAVGCSSSGKETEPVDISVDYTSSDASALETGNPATLEAMGRPWYQAGEVVIRFDPTGAVAVDGQQEFSFKNVGAKQKVEATAKVVRNGTYGAGTVTVTVEVLNSAGANRFLRRSFVSFYVTPEEVLIGDGLDKLKAQHLQHLKDKGIITEAQFQEGQKNLSRVPPVTSPYLP